MATTKQIIKHHKKLWDYAHTICSAIQPEGTNLSWDEYDHAIRKAKDFENEQ